MAQHHFYTTKPNVPAGYRMERIECYMPNSGFGTSTLYCFYNGIKHYYDTDSTPPPGYARESEHDVPIFTASVAGTVDLHRYYNAGADDHFYTINRRDYPDYAYEKIQGKVYNQAEGSRTPLYRFYNGTSGDHFYQRASDTPADYVMEGIEGYVSNTSQSGWVPLKRFWNPDISDHFYTTDPTVPLGYLDEGNEGYVSPIPGLGLARLHRYYNGKDHFYSLNPRVPDGYLEELIAPMYVYEDAGNDRMPWYRFFQNPPEEGGDVLGAIGSLVEAAFDAVTTVVNTVVGTVESVVGVVLNPVSAIVNFVFAIPVLRLIRQPFTIIRDFVIHVIILGVFNAIDFIASLLGIRPEKRLKLCVIIQTQDGVSVPPDEQVVRSAIQFSINVLKDTANVRILPVDPFHYSSPFADNPKADSIAIHRSEGTDESLNTNSGFGTLLDDVGYRGSTYELMMTTACFWSNFRRVVGYGAPVVAISVRSIVDAVGQSAGPLTDYVLVNFKYDDLQRNSSLSTALAHEIGHACNLWHVDDPENLMSGKSTPDLPGYRRKLTRWQISLLRFSRHVTYF